MATNFPTSLDTLTNPTSSDPLNNPSHSAQHANSNDAIEALQAKVGANSSAVTTSLDYKVTQLETDALPKTVVDAKGDLIAGTADNTVSRLAVGTNGQALIANSATATGLSWSAVGDVTTTGIQTLTNKTLTDPVINGAILDRTEENWNIIVTSAVGTINLNVLTASIWYYQGNAASNLTINVRGDGSTTLNSLLAVGDSITVVFANTNGAQAYYANVFQIDGSTVTPKWQGGTAYTGSSLSIDIYVYTIVKTAATPTYTVFASGTQFK
jgi:hypothetical protein